jgi:hypothetical protein
MSHYISGGRVQFEKIRGFLRLFESVSETTDRKPNLCVGRLSWRSSFYRVKRKEPDCLTSVNTSHGHFLRTSIETSWRNVVIPLHWHHTIWKEGDQSRFQSLPCSRARSNVVGYGCVLDALLCVRTSEYRKRKTHWFCCTRIWPTVTLLWLLKLK